MKTYVRKGARPQAVRGSLYAASKRPAKKQASELACNESLGKARREIAKLQQRLSEIDPSINGYNNLKKAVDAAMKATEMQTGTKAREAQ